MPFTTDQLGRRVELSQFPKRIVSLVPSQTELLYDLDLEEEVIGITRFCIHPEEWFRFKTRVGGTKQLHIEKIKELQPDLVLANKEENDRKQIEELEKDFPVWISDVNNLAGALQMIRSVGEITNRSPKAKQIADQIKKNFSQISTTVSLLPCCYLIWKDPYMTIGVDTCIN